MELAPGQLHSIFIELKSKGQFKDLAECLKDNLLIAQKMSERSVDGQCYQAARLFAQFLAIFNKVNVAKELNIFPKQVQHFGR